jgi:hypothetical protein
MGDDPIDDSQPSFVIGGSGDQLRFSHPWPDNGPVHYASVTVTLRGFRVGDQICFDDGGELPRFFDELAAEWKGWPGEKTWSSVDGSLRLACRHDGVGRVLITAHVAYMSQDQRISAGDWSGAGTVEVLPGSLDETAAGLRRFLRVLTRRARE